MKQIKKIRFNNELIFDYNEFGKPFLQGYPDFYYNISHSGVWVVCAISEKEVGIDIEQIKPVDLDIAKRFFSEMEYESLMMQPKELRHGYFYDLWTLKESYIKCVGKGLSLSLNSFSVCIDRQCIDVISANLSTIYLSQIFFDNQYKSSICSEGNIFAKKVEVIKVDDIKESLLYGNQRKNYWNTFSP